MHILLVILPVTVASLPAMPVAPANPNIAVASANKPSKGPYVAYWSPNTPFNGCTYYKITWHTTLTIGTWTMNFNDVMEPLKS